MSNTEEILVNERVVDALKSLGIPVIYGDEIKQKTDKYIMFSIYNEKETTYCDDRAFSATAFITMNYWFNNPKDLRLYKKIKKLMKENGFKFDDAKDLKQDGAYRGKNMDFEYEELI